MSRSIKGRGAAVQPPNPYLHVQTQADLEQIESDEDYLAQLGRPPTEYIPDLSQSIVTENDSPDVGFRYSVNPYRGCAWLQLLLRAANARIFRPQRGSRFRDQSPCEVPCGRAAARIPGPPQLETRYNRVFGRHRLLPAGRTKVRHHARLHGGGRRVPPARGHHHQELAGRARPRFAHRAGRSQGRARLAFHYVARSGAGSRHGAANQRRGSPTAPSATFQPPAFQQT